MYEQLWNRFEGHYFFIYIYAYNIAYKDEIVWSFKLIINDTYMYYI